MENGPFHDQLEYPATPRAPFRLGASEKDAVTFSASFRTSHEGELRVRVTPKGAGGQVLASGEAVAAIDVGHVTRITVRVALRAAAASCDPTAPAGCGAGNTCFVDCSMNRMTAGLCTAGGTRKPGEACERNEDCVPGAQCFEFGCAGATKPKACLQFCRSDAECGAGRCSVGVPCMDRMTDFRVCSRACDPTGAATTGCAAGLSCFLFPGEIPDCDCRAPSRTGSDGQSCKDSRECQPGLLCVTMSGAGTCRPLCRLDDPKCAAGTTCTRLVNPNFKSYGGCLP
jgi:hypothetical protein